MSEHHHQPHHRPDPHPQDKPREAVRGPMTVAGISFTSVSAK
jgi:hypothetical protein